MSDAKTYIINNASEVIEKFGGIRPMATKMGVAPTTVQGWKKRNTIPDNRIDDVVQAANENNIPLGTPAAPAKTAPVKPQEAAPVAKADAKPKTQPAPAKAAAAPVSKPAPKSAPERVEQKPAPVQKAAPAPQKEAVQIERMAPEKKAALPREKANDDNEPPKINMGAWIMSAFMITLLVTLLVMFWPMRDKILDKGKQLAAQAKSTVLVEQNAEPDVTPEAGENITETPKAAVAAAPEKTAEKAPEAVKEQQEEKPAAAEAPAAPENVDDGTAAMAALLADAPVRTILEQFKTIKAELSGGEQMERAASQLQGIVESLDGRLDLLDQALVIARDNSTTLGQTFADVPDEHLKAAASLLALTQLKQAIDQGGMPFADDLGLLTSITGKAATPFHSNLAKLAPYGDTGIDSRTELGTEFETLAEDIRGLPVEGDMGEKAQASLSKVLSVKKNGEQITGTKDERALSQIQSHVIAGRYKDALEGLDKLEGNAAALAKPYKNKLRASIAAGDVSLAIGTILDKAALKSAEAASADVLDEASGASAFRDLNIEP